MFITRPKGSWSIFAIPIHSSLPTALFFPLVIAHSLTHTLSTSFPPRLAHVVAGARLAFCLHLVPRFSLSSFFLFSLLNTNWTLSLFTSVHVRNVLLGVCDFGAE